MSPLQYLLIDYIALLFIGVSLFGIGFYLFRFIIYIWEEWF